MTLGLTLRVQRDPTNHAGYSLKTQVFPSPWPWCSTTGADPPRSAVWSEQAGSPFVSTDTGPGGFQKDAKHPSWMRQVCETLRSLTDRAPSTVAGRFPQSSGLLKRAKQNWLRQCAPSPPGLWSTYAQKNKNKGKSKLNSIKSRNDILLPNCLAYSNFLPTLSNYGRHVPSKLSTGENLWTIL